MRAAWGMAAALALTGCASFERPSCPNGQEHLRTAQLFFGQDIDGKSGVSEAQFRKFVDEELTPRFPDGLTILNSAGQWRASDNQLVREASKVVVIALPRTDDAMAKVEAARAAYKQKFRQQSVLLITQASCVSF